MALLQRLSQQLPNGAFGSLETRWSWVWSQRSALWQRFGLGARGGWTSPPGRLDGALGGTVAELRDGGLWGAARWCWPCGCAGEQLPALLRTEIQPGQEQDEPALQGIVHPGLQQTRMVFHSLLVRLEAGSSAARFPFPWVTPFPGNPRHAWCGDGHGVSCSPLAVLDAPCAAGVLVGVLLERWEGT